jgi:hypothetical protein
LRLIGVVVVMKPLLVGVNMQGYHKAVIAHMVET